MSDDGFLLYLIVLLFFIITKRGENNAINFLMIDRRRCKNFENLQEGKA